MAFLEERNDDKLDKRSVMSYFIFRHQQCSSSKVIANVQRALEHLEKLLQQQYSNDSTCQHEFCFPWSLSANE
ncbi:Protein of unknown function [Pyronema omphalodes CBS 100304]|uniref:Uncharacterized protein n=1 Tax=Pyronema omphalodes (strain CBS 100304) TaxID=1076935 RepID=U4KUP8_PYROM|nr:Protein of unknown function [Pyronema omphalodes CBS 100304]